VSHGGMVSWRNFNASMHEMGVVLVENTGKGWSGVLAPGW